MVDSASALEATQVAPRYNLRSRGNRMCLVKQGIGREQGVATEILSSFSFFGNNGRVAGLLATSGSGGLLFSRMSRRSGSSSSISRPAASGSQASAGQWQERSRSSPPRRTVMLPEASQQQTWARPMWARPPTREEDSKISSAQAEIRFSRKCQQWAGPTQEELEMEGDLGKDGRSPPPIQFDWQKEQWYSTLDTGIKWQLFDNPSFSRELEFQTLPGNGHRVSFCRSTTIILQRLAYSPSFTPQFLWVRSPAACSLAMSTLNRILGQHTRPQGSLEYALFGLDTEYFSFYGYNSWNSEVRELYGKGNQPLEKRQAGPNLIILQISAPGFCTFVFELKYIFIKAVYEDLDTVERRQRPEPYSALPEALRNFLVDPRVIFATCDGKADMNAIQRYCGLGSREDFPGDGVGRIGYVDLQSWARDLGLLKLGNPDPHTGRCQRHPPGLVNLVAYGLTGTVEPTRETEYIFEVKKREKSFDNNTEKAKVFLRKLSSEEKEYVIMGPAYTLFSAYSLMFMHRSKDCPDVLRKIRKELFSQFSRPLALSKVGLSHQCAGSVPSIVDNAKQVVSCASQLYKNFQAIHPGEGFIFQVEAWVSLHGRFGQLANLLNGDNFPRLSVDRRVGVLHSYFQLVHQEWRRRFKVGRYLNPVLRPAPQPLGVGPRPGGGGSSRDSRSRSRSRSPRPRASFKRPPSKSRQASASRNRRDRRKRSWSSRRISFTRSESDIHRK